MPAGPPSMSPSTHHPTEQRADRQQEQNTNTPGGRSSETDWQRDDSERKRDLLIEVLVRGKAFDQARSLVRFARDIIAQHGATVRVDWHGHDDRGLALANSLEAIAAGADRIHGCWLGIGERVGNTSLDQLWLNLAMMRGNLDATSDLRALRDVCEKVSEATRTPISADYPLLGANAFRTGTGVHASAILKAAARGDRALADRVYSSIPASVLGRRQEICIGPMSGLSNVHYWLRQAGIPDTPGLAAAVLQAAKQSDRNLTDSEIRHIVEAVSRGAAQ
mgnify:CR=1 FL=1